MLTAWNLEPSVLAGVAIVAAGYAAALAYGRRRGEAVPWGRAVSFGAGLLALLLALISPLDTLADGYLLSAHMAQHLLLILVFPPLALCGTPAWLLRDLVETRVGGWLERVGGNPLVALLAYTAGLGVWHLPVLYDAALLDERVHVVEHLTFIAVAFLFWWPVLAPLAECDRLGPLGRVGYLFLAQLPNALIAAPIAFAPDVLYAPYQAAADPLGYRAIIRGAWGLSARADQQLAGVIMWVPMGFTLTAIAVVILVRCLDGGEDEAEAEAAAPAA
jgi:cytochrome c oxidase assembly factor CtaG